MTYTPGSIEGKHVVLTGPITGSVTLPSGDVVDVSAPAVEARDAEHAAEIAHAIGLYWADPDTPAHPDHLERQDDGTIVETPFEYDDSHHKAAKRAAKKKG